MYCYLQGPMKCINTSLMWCISCWNGTVRNQSSPYTNGLLFMERGGWSRLDGQKSGTVERSAFTLETKLWHCDRRITKRILLRKINCASESCAHHLKKLNQLLLGSYTNWQVILHHKSYINHRLHFNGPFLLIYIPLCHKKLTNSRTISSSDRHVTHF